MGGRGSSSGGGGNLGNSSGGSVSIVSQTGVWSLRHEKGNESFVDQINGSILDIQRDFGGVMDTVQTVTASELSGIDRIHVLGFYGQNGLSVNKNYTNEGKMNAAYDKAVQQGFHPSRGTKTGTEAVTYHEMGHALTDHLAQKVGANNIDAASKKIVDNAYKSSGGKGGTIKFARGISQYATQSNAECVAEAVADFYCNGAKAAKASIAIVGELKRVNKL